MTLYKRSFDYSFKRIGQYTDKHHLFIGSGKRPVAEKYHLYIYIPHEYHLYTVHKNVKKYTKMVCEDIDVCYDTLNRLMNTNTGKWNTVEKWFMNITKEKFVDRERMS